MEQKINEFKKFVTEQLKSFDEFKEADMDGYVNDIADKAVKLFAIPNVVGRSEQLKADLYAFRDMFCQNVDISTIDEYVEGLGF